MTSGNYPPVSWPAAPLLFSYYRGTAEGFRIHGLAGILRLLFVRPRQTDPSVNTHIHLHFQRITTLGKWEHCLSRFLAQNFQSPHSVSFQYG